MIDTVGIKAGPFAMIDWFGTPQSPALHVIERYRLIRYEEAQEGYARDAKENDRTSMVSTRLPRQGAAASVYGRRSEGVYDAVVGDSYLPAHECRTNGWKMSAPRIRVNMAPRKMRRCQRRRRRISELAAPSAGSNGSHASCITAKWAPLKQTRPEAAGRGGYTSDNSFA